MIQQIIKWLGRSEKFKLTSSPKKTYDSTTELICVKRELGLGSAVVMTLGCIVGAGLFLSPKGVLMCTGSVGMSLMVWSVAGIISMIGALCYVELGTCIPSSGSHFTYIKMLREIFQRFLYLWVQVVILTPVAMIILSLTFANYMLETIFYQCVIPQGAVRLIAALPICILTFINCRNVQWVTRLQGVFTAAKSFAIILIIVGGVYHLCKGKHLFSLVELDLMESFTTPKRSAHTSSCCSQPCERIVNCSKLCE
ncbi:large neutral amino acids transporter small subunit 2 [Caerostris extrusa]|uniref:Large neutral amino acids transporter small subunit 2 n=1 Tax=Caerostris extrusa TaxID=172846 RepID=A0AAV4NGR2_CAEEX|nr:large neutral amino acids transporter small subunit 2 [Caerostris extrusa]